MASTNNQVAEMQGLYGPFTVAERVVQKIWLRGDFAQSRAVLTDGRRLEVRSAGRWNRLGGPDFRGASLVIAGRAATGDVEVHFHAVDWRAHGHGGNPAFDHVVLHVVLFPLSAGERPAVRGDGQEIPTLVLLPLLHRDLEEYASDEALETITARDDWKRFAELSAKPALELPLLLQRKAAERWRQKLHFARMRIKQLGWSAAAHQTALEILGYRQNRAAMLVLAARYPLETWANGLDPLALLAEAGVRWQLQGTRPANHPLARLRQYQRWVAANPDWPEQLLRFSAALPKSDLADLPTKPARQVLALAKIRAAVARELMGSVVRGTRLDNLVCDGFLPLAAAQTGRDLFAVWFHWFLGDVPKQVRTALPRLGVAGGGTQPLAHGWAQGLLGWMLEREARPGG